MNTKLTAVKRLLIYRQGSLGDTLVALPALRLIEKCYPRAERRMLTNFSVSEKAAPIAALLDGTDLVHGYFRYPYGLRNPLQLWSLANEIRRWQPDLLVYLNEPRGRVKAVRDALFFLSCGVRRMLGVPLSKDLHVPQLQPDGLYEHKTDRLDRILQPRLGSSKPHAPDSWNLALSAAERLNSQRALAPLGNCPGFIAASIGAKVSAKDWGDDNWRILLQSIAPRLDGWGLAMIGAPSEGGRTERLLQSWAGPAVNLCGSVSLRESAAILEKARLYIGHDSGPMHLSAAVGTPCVAIFSARNYPGEWYPYGRSHIVFYNKVECFGCRLDDCIENGKKCILSISPATVADQVIALARSKPATLH